MGYENKVKSGYAVYGIFKDQTSLEKAVDSFKAHGFRNSDISALMHSPKDSANFATEKHTKAPEGATTGAAAGVLAGGALGWLIGAGALAIPGVGPFIAAGPIMAALAGAGIGGTVGGITGGLIGLGIPEIEAKRYEDFIKKGGLLLSVHVDDNEWALKAKLIFEDSGGQEVSSSMAVVEDSSTEARIYKDRYDNEGRYTAH